MKATLFVPKGEHRDALLRDGPRGARPPVASFYPGGSGQWGASAYKPLSPHFDPEQQHALVLGEGGTCLIEGCDRFFRYLRLNPFLIYNLDYVVAVARAAPDVGVVVEARISGG